MAEGGIVVLRKKCDKVGFSVFLSFLLLVGRSIELLPTKAET